MMIKRWQHSDLLSLLVPFQLDDSHLWPESFSYRKDPADGSENLQLECRSPMNIILSTVQSRMFLAQVVPDGNFYGERQNTLIMLQELLKEMWC